LGIAFTAFDRDSADVPATDIVSANLTGAIDRDGRMMLAVEILLNGLVGTRGITDQDRKPFFDDTIQPIPDRPVQARNVSGAANKDLGH
jgi:hypothetical protein